MKKNYLSALVVLTLIITPLLSNAQFSGAMHFNYNEALSDYKHNIQSSPVGISFSGMHAISKSQLSVGAELGVSMFANEDYTKDLTEDGYAGAMVDIYEEDCYVSYYALTRYELTEEGLFIPYLEGKVGAISFFNDKVYEDPYGSNAPNSMKDKTEFLGTSFQYGVGGGILFQLSEMFPSVTEKVLVDFGFTLLNGTETNYRSVNYTEEIVRSSKDIEYNSRTNNINYKLGVMMRF